MKAMNSRLKLGIMTLLVGVGVFQTACRPEQVVVSTWALTTAAVIVANTPPSRPEPKGRCIVWREDKNSDQCVRVRDFEGRWKTECPEVCTVRSHRQYAVQIGETNEPIDTTPVAKQLGLGFQATKALMSTLEAAGQATNNEQALQILSSIGVTPEHFSEMVKTGQAPADMINSVARALDSSPIEIGSMFETVGNELRAKYNNSPKDNQ